MFERLIGQNGPWGSWTTRPGWYVVRSPKDRSSLPLWRATNGTEVLDYLIRRAPQAAWVTD